MRPHDRTPIDPVTPDWPRLIAASYRARVGGDLGADLERADRAILAHALGDDPRIVYVNGFAAQLWERPPRTFLGMPSRRTAPPEARAERAGALAPIGVVTGYRGERISATGRRFVIRDATVWPVLDDAGTVIGQAATFREIERVTRPLLEVLATTPAEVAEAVARGADRIELCVDYPAGGTTPPPDLIREAVALTAERSIGVMVMIRPRGGDFVYAPDEIATMRREIRTAVAAGASGLVLGCLTPAGAIDMEAVRAFLAAADGVPVTFHRAVDVAVDPVATAAAAFALGCARVLTSGGAPTAPDGVATIRRMLQAAPPDRIVLPGSGVRGSNADALRAATGAIELHASLAYFRG